MSKELYLPALRCLMGKWLYYTTSMTLQEVADRVVIRRFAESEALGELLQRQFRGKRKTEIADYLIHESQHFLGALVIAVNGGDPSWLEIDVKPSSHFSTRTLSPAQADRLEKTIGFLRLSGEEELWALDGQHRLGGIQEGVGLDPALANDEITVVFVGHETSKKGKERTRRLFTTLNRNAKAITPGERIALDEDDACAILTRRLVESHPLLKGGRVGPLVDKQLSPSQTEAFTVISMIYSVCFRLLDKRMVIGQTWRKSSLLDGRRPTDKQLDALYEEACLFWNGLVEHVPEVAEFLATKKKTGKAMPYRSEAGGHLLFRPAGLDAYARAYRKLRDLGNTSEQAFDLLGKVKTYRLQDSLWSGVLWSPAKKTVLAKSLNRELAADLMLYKAGVSMNADDLRDRYRVAVEDDKAELP